MRVYFDDTSDNWEKWGTLVVSWINGTNTDPRPVNTDQLNQQMTAKGITGVNIPGVVPRPVKIVDYLDGGPLYIWLPSAAMLKDKLCTVGTDSGPYPTQTMPAFYDAAYGGAARAIMSAALKNEFALQRIGEYVINECC